MAWLVTLSSVVGAFVTTIWAVRLAKQKSNNASAPAAPSVPHHDGVPAQLVGQLFFENQQLRNRVADLEAWKGVAEARAQTDLQLIEDLRAQISALLNVVRAAAAERPTTAMNMAFLASLRAVLVARFNTEELTMLARDAGLGDQAISGESKAAQADNLITYAERRGRLADLIAEVERARPGTTHGRQHETTRPAG